MEEIDKIKTQGPERGDRFIYGRNYVHATLAKTFCRPCLRAAEPCLLGRDRSTSCARYCVLARRRRMQQRDVLKRKGAILPQQPKRSALPLRWRSGRRMRRNEVGWTRDKLAKLSSERPDDLISEISRL